MPREEFDRQRSATAVIPTVATNGSAEGIDQREKKARASAWSAVNKHAEACQPDAETQLQQEQANKQAMRESARRAAASRRLHERLHNGDASADLEDLSRDELLLRARQYDINDHHTMSREALMAAIRARHS